MGLLDRLRRLFGLTSTASNSPGRTGGRYRLIERATGRVLAETNDQEEALAMVGPERRGNWEWDELDLLDESGESLMLRDHERGVDRFLGRHDRPRPYPDLETGRAAGDGWLVADGDWGGQVFLTAPCSMVGCPPERLIQLVDELDYLSWGNMNGEGSTSLTYRAGSPGDGVIGGMGGGALVDGLWVHPDFEDLGWTASIEAVLRGHSETLVTPAPPPTLTSEVIERIGGSTIARSRVGLPPKDVDRT